jgi:hypothetical protein
MLNSSNFPVAAAGIGPLRQVSGRVGHLPRLWCVWLGLVLTALVSGVAAGQGAGNGGPPARHAVTNVPSFLAALGSDRTIELSAGEYLLEPAKASGMTSSFWRFEEVWDGQQLVVTGVSNLTVRGRGLETPVRVRPRYAAVLTFKDARGLRFENLHLSHVEEAGYCTGPVLQFESSANIRIKRCQMLGSGTYGVWLRETEDLTVTNSVISDCTYGAVWAENSRQLRIMDSTIEDNEHMDLVTLLGCRDVVFRDSRFRRNRNSFGELLNYALFAVHDCSGVRVERCVFGPEQAGHLVDTLGSVLFEECEFSENTWLRGKYAPAPDSRGEDEVR